MWETQLEIKYEDYQLEDVNLDHLMNNTAAILQSLTPSKLKQIEGTCKVPMKDGTVKGGVV